jgi:pimeloyl-ACP methyl ester carboxylesterase
MIAQMVALEHPERVLSLTSIFSMTGDPEVYQPVPEALATMFAPAPDTKAEAIAQSVAGSRITHGSLFDEAEVTAVAIESYERSRHPLGGAFQAAAMAATGDRTERLRSLDVPTLVVHGREDPLIPLACGEHTAATIPGADLLVFGRMGHDIPKLYWPALADAIYNIAVRGEDR